MRSISLTDQKFPTGPTKIAPKRLAVPTLFQSIFPPFSICPNPLATYKTNHLYFNEGKLYMNDANHKVQNSQT